MENNLPKFASTVLDGEDDKATMGADLDDIVSSDIEIETDNV